MDKMSNLSVCGTDCGECDAAPCEIWMKTRDPKYSDEEFAENVRMRIETLKSFSEKKTASQIQKERIKELEGKANALIQQCEVATLTSINEKGYPRTCLLSIAKADGFSDIYFVTSKRSEINGKATHFEKNPKASVCYFLNGDSVTLIGNVKFIEDRETQKAVWSETDRKFFKKGIDDPKFRLIKFHTIEATFWIEGKFRTCKYK